MLNPRESIGAGVEVWWTRHAFTDGDRALLCIGPLALWVDAAQHEWRVAHLPGRDPRQTEQSVERAPSRTPPEDAPAQRFGFGGERRELRVEPTLPDRPIVARPELALTILAGSELTIYISSPLSIALHHGDDPKPMLDVPTMRLSNTWFGGPTVPGGLCYALRTRARLSLGEHSFHPVRALSTVVIRNRASTHLHVERIRLPMRELSLYHSREQGFWTNGVTIERRAGDDELAEVAFERKPPHEGLAVIQPPRELGERHVLQRALAALLS